MVINNPNPFISSSSYKKKKKKEDKFQGSGLYITNYCSMVIGRHCVLHRPLASDDLILSSTIVTRRAKNSVESCVLAIVHIND